MILVKKIKCDLYNENCYIVYDDKSLDAIIIDPGSNFEDIISFINECSLKVNAILLTHGHFDHIVSCKKLQDLGYRIYVSKDDAYMCTDNKANFSLDNGFNIDTFEPDVLITKNQDFFKFGSILVKVVFVAGHSRGGLAYLIDKNLFAGDTLFEHGYGRTDLDGGNFGEILSSIKILREYVKSGYILYSGHDY